MTGENDAHDDHPGPTLTSELAQQLRIGDRAAFQELYDRVAPVLYTWTRLHMLGSLNANLDPQDVLQEVWLRALRGLEGYDPARSFRGWILGIAKNVLLQSYQRLGRDPGQGASRISSASTRGTPQATGTSVSLQASKDESLQRFIRYVEALEVDDRTILIYCGLEGYTCAQAAARVGVSAEAAVKRWQAPTRFVRAAS
jgi:RNA polymerase sigma-70 factor (ECF subfamily)